MNCSTASHGISGEAGDMKCSGPRSAGRHRQWSTPASARVEKRICELPEAGQGGNDDDDTAQSQERPLGKRGLTSRHAATNESGQRDREQADEGDHDRP